MASVVVLGADVVDLDLAEAPDRSQRAFVRAANRSIKSGQSLMLRLVAYDTRLKQKDVRAAMPVSEASLSRPSAKLEARLKRIPLIDFGARGPMPSRGRGRGVTAKTQAGRYPNAFIARMKSGRVDVFVRVGGQAKDAHGPSASRRKSAGAWTPNLPIAKLYGPSIAQVFSRFRPQGVTRVLEVFDKNFDHELAFASGRATGAAATD